MYWTANGGNFSTPHVHHGVVIVLELQPYCCRTCRINLTRVVDVKVRVGFFENSLYISNILNNCLDALHPFPELLLRACFCHEHQQPKLQLFVLMCITIVFCPSFSICRSL